MPLNPSSLQSSLQSLFASPPGTRAACGQAWADAVKGYAASIVPASTTVNAAASTLASSLASAFAAPSAASGFDAAFAAFATTVGTGMAAAGFTGTHPASPLNVASLLSSTRPTHAAAAAAFSSLIDAWFRTGLATLIAPPNTVVPWS